MQFIFIRCTVHVLQNCHFPLGHFKSSWRSQILQCSSSHPSTPSFTDRNTLQSWDFLENIRNYYESISLAYQYQNIKKLVEIKGHRPKPLCFIELTFKITYIFLSPYLMIAKSCAWTGKEKKLYAHNMQY